MGAWTCVACARGLWPRLLWLEEAVLGPHKGSGLSRERPGDPRKASLLRVTHVARGHLAVAGAAGLAVEGGGFCLPGPQTQKNPCQPMDRTGQRPP